MYDYSLRLRRGHIRQRRLHVRNGSAGGRAGSSNSAAAFLKQFVPNYNFDKEDEQIPWIHLDIAGTAWGPGGKAKSEASNPLFKFGTSGVHVKTLHRMITDND